jgi:hypothetical protein
MTQTAALSVIVNGVETSLATIGALVGHSGWGMPKMDTYSLRSPGQHGDSWGGFALAPRVAALTFKMDQTNLDQMYTLRSQILSLFSPLAAQTLKFVTVEGTRCFDCRYYDGLDLNWEVRDWAAQGFGLLLKAGDPTCYDPVGAAWTFSLAGGADTFLVPYEVPYKLGASTINESKVITYPGTWLTYPIIRITGPIEDCTITNQATGEVLSFDTTTIAAGDYYEIDCRFGLKTVKDAAGVNQISKLTTASNLSTFHLAPSPEVAGGINSINVYGISISASSKIEISYFVRYLGI